MGDRWRRKVAAGERIAFGRGGVGVDVVLADDDRLHRCCGIVTVDETGWDLQNTGRWLRLRIVSLDRFGVDSLLPGQHLRVPWTDSRVQVHVGDRCHEFRALHLGAALAMPPAPAGGTEASHRRTADDDERDDGDDVTVVPVRVDRASGYFRALVALCEPQLLDPSTTAVATDLQIARRLNSSGLESTRLTGKTVERRLDNCRVRFGLKVVDDLGMSAGLERRDARRVLVDLALLTATVTVRDLVVLGEDRDLGGFGRVDHRIA